MPGRRYSFRNQPAAVAWNVERLAAAFVMNGLVEDLEGAGEAVEVYSKALSSTYEGIVAAKMGKCPPPPPPLPFFFFFPEEF